MVLCIPARLHSRRFTVFLSTICHKYYRLSRATALVCLPVASFKPFFEVAYWLILAYLLGKELNITLNKGLNIIASSYGVGLIIWVVAVMFFILNMS
tara:strand:- start:345 stop:635 length:291 start_codon:yes stop_codon:yes gene_type:complete